MLMKKSKYYVVRKHGRKGLVIVTRENWERLYVDAKIEYQTDDFADALRRRRQLNDAIQEMA